MDRHAWGSWLSGPRSLAEATGTDLGHRGRRLGLPETGSGSVASFGRRFGAVVIDWTIFAQLIAIVLVGPDAGGDERAVATMGVFAVMNLAFVTTVGAGIGGRMFGLRVVRTDGTHPSMLSVLIRTVLLCLVIPALIWDRDTRGLHDKAAGTMVLRR